MIGRLRRILRHPRFAVVKQAIFLLRGVAFVGRRYRCPCCGWQLRGFVGRWGLVRANDDGYCPRCNAKARHRRIWLYLEATTSLPTDDHRVLEVAPWWSIARKLQAMGNVDFVGVDLEVTGPQVTIVGDATHLPCSTDAFDIVLCTHVLEHVEDDRRAIAELFRVVAPGGFALVSVPIRLDRPTYEDPSITDPAARAIAFGERSHVRLYGRDLPDRLTEAGFQVVTDRAADIPSEVRLRFGLRDDENLFRCGKPRPVSPG